MNPEDILKSFRLDAPAGDARGRVLAAVRAARFEQRLWRWTWAAAAVVFAVAIPVNVAADWPRAPRTNPAVERKVDQFVAFYGDEKMRSQFRLALLLPSPSEKVPR